MDTSRMGWSSLTQIQLATLKLIKTFIERQKLVLEAMEEVAPDKLFYSRNDVTEETAYDPPPYIPDPRPEYWGSNNEWKVFAHGAGCKLTNVNTGEPIEWDCPDVDVFDAYWFSCWLSWVLKYPHNIDEATSTIRHHLLETQNDVKTFVFEIIEQFTREGILVDAKWHGLPKYRFLDAFDL